MKKILSRTPAAKEIREPRKKKRPLTQNRREQNRRAQKLYRERQKTRRLEDLTGVSLESEVGDQINNIDYSDSLDNELDENDGAIATINLDENNSNSTPPEVPDAFDYQPQITSKPLVGNVEYWTTDSLKGRNINLVPSSSKTVEVQTLGNHVNPLNHSTYWLSENIEQSWLPATPLMTFSGTSTNVAYVASTSAEEQIPSNSIDRGREELTKMFYENKIKYEDVMLAGLEALSRKAIREKRQREISPASSSRIAGSQAAYMPSPAKIHIPMVRISLIAACIANAAHIGLEFQNTLGPGTEIHRKPISTCHKREKSEERSPFFSPTRTSLNITQTYLASCYEFLKPDLRPCIAQVTQEHALYIDVFPFPAFRERILALRACVINSIGGVGSDIFNESDLTQDIDSGGIVCWGADSPTGTGTPWDHRSWEFRPWFLRKWWMLTGGMEGELGRQSAWWAEMRGEVFDEN